MKEITGILNSMNVPRWTEDGKKLLTIRERMREMKRLHDKMLSIEEEDYDRYQRMLGKLEAKDVVISKLRARLRQRNHIVLKKLGLIL